MDAAAVRAAIEAAWRDLPPPEGTLCPGWDEGVGAYFGGRTWQGHTIASLRYHSVALSFLRPDAWAYYLPAFMLAVLEDSAAADVINDSITYTLSPEQLGLSWADRYRARLACLTDAQRAAVIAFLAWYGKQEATIEYLRTSEAPAAPQWRITHDELRLSYTTTTDRDLAALREHPSLRALDLTGTPITDEALAHVATLAHLETLDLSGTKVTPAGLARIATLPSLRVLKLVHIGLDDAGLRALAPLRLRELDVTNNYDLTDAGWAAIDVSRLEQLGMYSAPLGRGLAAALGAAGVLRRLVARELAPGALAELAKAPLERLEIRAGDAIAPLANLATLKELSINGDTPAWPAGWPALERLTLLDLPLRAAVGQGLGALPALRELSVLASRYEPGALAGIARAPQLAELKLWADHTPLALDELAGAPSLTRLAVHHASVAPAGLAAVARIPMLDTLELHRMASFERAHADALATVPVHRLDLSEIALDDALLAALGAMPRLAYVRLPRTQVSDGALAAFRAAHPAVEVVPL